MEIRPWQICLLSRKLKRGVDGHSGWLADVAGHEAWSRLSKEMRAASRNAKSGRWLVMNLERRKQQVD